MKAQELRIGNLVNRLGALTSITVISADHISTLLSGAVTLNQIEPIPITEKWLLKLGFEKCQNYYSLNGFDIDDKGWIGFNNMVADCKVQYVHQLQNLYFALTGKELEVKP